MGDIEGLHPITLYQRKTLTIDVCRVPYLALNAGGKGCYGGAQLTCFGHETVALKCFARKLGDSGTECLHCEQL